MDDNYKTSKEYHKREKDAKFVHKGKVDSLQNLLDLVNRQQNENIKELAGLFLSFMETE